MDSQRFDQLTRVMSRLLTRRHLAGQLAAQVAAIALHPETRTVAKKKKKKCKAGTVKCGKICVNKQTNPKHCGGCNRPCPPGAGCANGQCQTSCQSPNTQCGADCVDTDTDEKHCGACGHACEASQTCDDGECVAIVTCATGCRLDQTCQGESGYCPCSRECGAGWCGDCCTDGECQGNVDGNHCVPSPGKSGNYICGCRQPTDPSDTRVVRPCGPQSACSYCCADDECSIRYGEGYICPAGNLVTGRSCCIAPGAACGGNSQCCSNNCFGGTCTCLPFNAFCDQARAHYCCTGSCVGGRCAI